MLYASVPLPGPFRWHPGRWRYRRVRRSRFSHLSYWLSGVFLLEMAFWLLVGEALLAWYAGKGAVWLYRRWRDRHTAAAPVMQTAAPQPVNPRMYHSARR